MASSNDIFPLFFASDIHADEHGFDRELFARDFDRAKKDKARILINGDVFGAILPSDLKRYTRGNDSGDTDGKINAAVKTIEELLAPFADQIDMIGLGNHETAVLKYHSIDLTSLLIAFLARHRDPKLPPIKHGGYTGFIRYIFEGPSRSHSQKIDIFYNHGQGGSAEVTDGIIDAKRRLYTKADIIWLGHKHKRWAHEIDHEQGMDVNGRVYDKKRWAIMTGSYLKNIGETDATKNGYRLSYPEERMRTTQGTGGIRANIVVSRGEIYPEFTV